MARWWYVTVDDKWTERVWARDGAEAIAAAFRRLGRTGETVRATVRVRKDVSRSQPANTLEPSLYWLPPARA